MSTDRTAMDRSNDGLRLHQAGDYEGAITAFTEVIELNPRSTAAYYHRADAYRRTGRASDAERDVEKARALHGDSERDSARRKAKEGQELKTKVGKVRQRPFGLWAQYGEITIGPSKITFQRA